MVCYMRYGYRSCAVHLSGYPGGTGTMCEEAIRQTLRDLSTARLLLARVQAMRQAPGWFIGEPGPLAHDAVQTMRRMRRILRAGNVPIPHRATFR